MKFNPIAKSIALAFIFQFFFHFQALANPPGLIMGLSSVQVGQVTTYTFDNGTVYNDVQWYVGNGTIQNSSISGSTYTVTIEWTGTGTTNLQFAYDTDVLVTQKAITISLTGPTALTATNILSNGFTANWNVVSGASSYRLDVATNSSFTSMVSGYSALTVIGTSQNVTGLAANTNYYYRVRAVVGASTSSYSSIITTTTSLNAPVVSAATAITVTSFTANWATVSGASSYRLDVSTDGSFSTFVSGYNNLTVSTLSKSITGLSSGTNYHYRVRSINASSNASINSNTISAVTIPPPPSPLAGINVSGTSFTANWNPTSGATSYRLDVSISSSFSSYITGYNNLTLSGTTQNVTGLTINTPYYYRVRAVNSSGTSGNSVNTTVTTGPTPPTTAAASNITQTSFTANWGSVAGATEYRLDVSTSSSFSSFATGYENFLVNGVSQTVTDLTVNTKYYYRVRVKNANGFSNSSANQTVYLAPIFEEPLSGQVIFKGYDLNIKILYQNNIFTNGVADIYKGAVKIATTGFGFGGFGDGFSSNVDISAFDFGSDYRVKVYSSSNANLLPVWSDYFTIAPLPGPVALAATSITETSFVFNCTPYQDAQLLRLDVSTDPNFGSFIHNDRIYMSLSGTVSTGLAPGTTYYYRIRVESNPGSFGTSPNSNIIVVTTLPVAPTLTASTILSNTSFTANWGSVMGAAEYSIDVSTSNNFSSFAPGYQNLAVNGVNQTVTGLTANTIYYYRVRAKNAGGYSSYSITQTVYLAPTFEEPLSGQVIYKGYTLYVKFIYRGYLIGSTAEIYKGATKVATISGFGSGADHWSSSLSTSSFATGNDYRVKVFGSDANLLPVWSDYFTIDPLPPPVATAATSVSSNGFAVNCTPYQGASYYIVDISTDPNFTSFVYNSMSISGSTVITGMINPATTYYYRLKATGFFGTSPYSNTITVLTLPVAPTALSATNIFSAGFTANWSSVTGATNYRLDISTASDFSVILPDYNNLQVTAINLNVPNLTEKVTYYYRVRAENGSGASANSNIITAVNLDQNYVRTVDVLVDGAFTEVELNNLTTGQKLVTYNFFDGLGRPSQKVLQQQTPDLQDFVQPFEFDVYGREAIKYLPYAAGSDGWFKFDFLKKDDSNYATNANPQYQFYQGTPQVVVEQKPYSESRFEQSPLSRVIKQGAAGSDWQPNAPNSYSSTDNTVKKAYETNAANEVLLWTYTAPTVALKLGLVNAGTVVAPTHYAANLLYKTKTKDVRQHQVIEYTDMAGKVVLKREQSVEGDPSTVDSNKDVNYASTYYVYDDFGNLVCVIPPEATKLITQVSPVSEYLSKTDGEKDNFLSRWSFRYAYDTRRRISQKQMPGAEPVYVVYDALDRIVLTQDGLQRNSSPKYWGFTKYDELNRPILTGIKDTVALLTQAEMQGVVDTYYSVMITKPWRKYNEKFVGTTAPNNVHAYTNNSYPVVTSAAMLNVDHYLTVSYYDNYAFRSDWSGIYTYVSDGLSNSGLTQISTGSENQWVKGQVTGTKVKVLDGGMHGGGTWLKAVNYYDSKYKVIQTLSDNIKGGTDRISNLHDFTGKRLQTKTTHTIGGNSKSVTRTFEYDHSKRLIRVWHQIDNSATILIAKNEYNELGQLVDKSLHSTSPDASDSKQSIDFRYNIRGWLTSMNNASLVADETNDDSSDYFGMNLSYNIIDADLNNIKYYNGNIAALKWSNYPDDSRQKGYTYSYDALNRITSSTFREKKSSWTSTENNEFTETGYSYDLNGNIKFMQRNDGREDGWMDEMTYYYGIGITQSNKLLKVEDAGDDSAGFVDGNPGPGDDYTYDASGNLTHDLNKGIGTSMSDPTNIITYNFLNLPETITKGGNLIRYIYNATGQKLSQVVTFGSATKRTDYVGEFIYENDVLQQINHEEGRVMLSGNKLVYPDHCETVASMTSSNASLEVVTQNQDKYVKVIANGTVSRTGVRSIGGEFFVTPGGRYRIRVKGYNAGTNDAHLLIQSETQDLNWPGAKLPSSAATESWVEQTVTIPADKQKLTVGVVWNSTANGEIMYLNEVEISKLEAIAPEYQYNLKDHLGNIRLTFTTKQEVETDIATMETASVNEERTKFLNYDEAVKINYALFNHTSGSATNYSIRLKGGNETYGLVRSLSVMPGDKIDIEVYAKYLDPEPTHRSTELLAFIASIQPGGGAVPGTFLDGGAAGSMGAQTFPYIGLLTRENDNGTGPKAYLNYILFDRDFNYKTGGFRRLSENYRETGTDVGHDRLAFDNLVIKEPGYIYIYLSNENETPVEVFFDDFKVTHTKSPIIETSDYYPFGLTFNSYSRENSVSNDYKYNGKELQDELNLGWLDFGARYYDPAIGLWRSIDPLSEKAKEDSPYMSMGNNPLLYVDPDGKFKIPIHERIMRNAIQRSRLDGGQYGEVHLTLIRSVGQRADILGGFADNHFDGRKNFKAIQASWKQLNNEINKSVNDIGPINKYFGGLDFSNLAVKMHSVADFYSHSNYVELYIEYYKSANKGAMPTAADVPIYQEGLKIKEFRKLMERDTYDENGKYQGLHTGEFNLKDNEFWDINPFSDKHTGPNSHKETNKDKADTPEGKLAEEIATKHTTGVLERVN